MSARLRSLASGALLGAALACIGFSSWDEVHAMFLFADLRLTLTFASAVALLLLAWWLRARKGGSLPARKPMHKGIVPGSLLFGLGWAVAGACPGIAFVQLGEGQLGALVTLVGMVLGNAAFAALNARFLGVPASSCAEP